MISGHKVIGTYKAEINLWISRISASKDWNKEHTKNNMQNPTGGNTTLKNLSS